jgi:hypothetical protein
MIAGSNGSTHGDSTLKTPAPNAAMSEGIWGSVMSYNRRARVLILGVNDWRLFVIFWNGFKTTESTEKTATLCALGVLCG